MTNKTLEAKIKQYSDIDAEAVSDAVDFLRRGTRGRSVSGSIDMWANIDRVIYRELVRRWNASEPVHAAETFAGRY